MMQTLVCALPLLLPGGGAPAPADPPTDAVPAAELEQLLGMMRSWRSPVRYRCELLTLELADANTGRYVGDPAVDALRASLGSDVRVHAGQVAALREAVRQLHAQKPALGDELFVYEQGFEVAFTPHAEMQRCDPPDPEELAWILKTVDKNITCDPLNNQLSITSRSRSPLICVPGELLRPLPVDPVQIDTLRKFDWSRSTSAGPAGTSLWVGRPPQPGSLSDPSLAPLIDADGNFDGGAIELELAGGGALLPLRCRVRTAAGMATAGFFSYAPASESDQQLWVETAVYLSEHLGNLMVKLYTISKVRFDVAPEMLLGEVPAGMVLFDFRDSETKHLGTARFKWPEELLEHLR
ncbi:MAG: hypothetical protein AAF682_11470 [Planctomycetota bacterium]